MKIIEVVADAGHMDTVSSIAGQHGVTDLWMGPAAEDGRRALRLLVDDTIRQKLLDALQTVLSSSPGTRIVVIPVEASLPKPAPEADDGAERKRAVTTTREELYDSVERSTHPDRNFFLLVFLSTIVVAIGLLEDNVAVVIGAMVIAPLLGPNIALALGTALGDTELMWESLKTNLAGLALALSLSVVIGFVWPVNIAGHELLARTDVGLDSVALALASGAAAVLSMTTGLPSVLVGVMVAVALLPPTAALGLTLGAGRLDLAGGAALLLAVNVVCVNLAAKLAFLAGGIRPRTWLERRKARQSMRAYILVWLVSLAILIAAIVLRGVP